MGRRLEGRVVSEPGQQAGPGPNGRPDEANDGTVRFDYQADVPFSGTQRGEHAEGAQPPLCKHRETAHRHQPDEQHPHGEAAADDDLGERVGLRGAGRRLHVRPNLLGRDTGRVEQHGDLARPAHLAGRHQGELVLEVLGVLDQPHHAKGRLVVALGPTIADFQARGRTPTKA